MLEDLTRGGVRFIPELERAYSKCVGLQKELARLLLKEETGGIMLATECGILTIRPKETDQRIVLARFDGRTPSTDEEYELVCKAVDAFRVRVRGP